MNRYIAGKLDDIVDFVITAITDALLLGVWLSVEYVLEQYVFAKLPVSSELATICFWIFRILFALSTLGLCAFAIYRDFRLRWIRSQAEIKRETEVVKDKTNPNEWHAEEIDYDDEGRINVTLFLGPDAEKRARAYANWQNSLIKVKFNPAS